MHACVRCAARELLPIRHNSYPPSRIITRRYLRAASQGDDKDNTKDNTKAQNNLGFMFANGRGVEKDEVEAVK